MTEILGISKGVARFWLCRHDDGAIFREAVLGKIGCVAIVRNEERHIAEWLAWQFVAGFDTVFLMDNGSSDRTAAIAHAMASRFDVRVTDWPLRTPDYQKLAYDHAISNLLTDYEWAAFFDTDEFLVLDDGLDLRALLASRAEAAVAIPWAIFGSSGHEEHPPGLVTECFLHRSLSEFPPNKHVKSIIRPRRAGKALNPHVFEMDGDYVDLFGQALSWESPGYLAAPPVYRGAKLHHYFTRARAAWRQKLARGYPDMVRTEAEFDDYDRNDVFDDSALKGAALVKTQLASVGAPPAAATAVPRLGITITTFNRRDMLADQLEKIRALTTGDYELVVCDDGSSDGTAKLAAQMGVRVITGANRGIAWNKNRGIYYLLHVARCDVILLLDDDIVPDRPGWEREWVEAALRWGHVNQAHPAYLGSVVAGERTAASPGVASAIPGWALAFSRTALSQIGYVDTRFGRYGHEHSEFSFRAVRAGYGGIYVTLAGQTGTFFYVIDGGLLGVPSVTSGTEPELEANAKLLGALSGEPVYRHAWRTDAEMADFMQEIAASMVPAVAEAMSWRPRVYASIQNHQDQMAARISGAAALDLGEIKTIREIRLRGAAPLGEVSLSVSIDGQAWVELTCQEVEGPGFVWSGPGAAWARYARAALVGGRFLPTHQIEVLSDET